MKRILRIVLLAIVALTLSTHMPAQRRSNTSVFQDANIQSQLDALTKRGFTYRFLDPTTVELTEKWSGMKQVKSLKEPSEAEIREWAASRGVPVVEIDPNQIDTIKYSGWYTFWQEVPISSEDGVPVVVADIDQNTRVEFYGTFKDSTSWYEAKAFDVDSGGTTHELFTYSPYPGIARTVADAQSDGKKEVLFTFGGNTYDYEQIDPSSIPTELKFVHNRHTSFVSPVFTGIYVGHLDQDSAVDFLYKGSEPDSSGDSLNGIAKIYVAEYDSASNNFVRVWSTELVLGTQSYVGGFSVDDFDADGQREFIASDLFTGQVFDVENTIDNEYQLVWQDSTGFVNVYYHGSGDVDNDGVPEFIIGATMSTGNWTVVYESDGNNSYAPRVVFHILSAGTFDNPVYLTSDMDGNGDLELIVFSGADLYMFKGAGNNSYTLWCYKRFPNRKAVCVYDVDSDGKKDLVINKQYSNSQGQLRLYTDLYRASPLVSVNDSLEISVRKTLRFDVFPNPSNFSFNFLFSASSAQGLELKIYSIAGQLVFSQNLSIKPNSNGTVVWDASQKASGIYIVRLSSNNDEAVRKVLLLK